MSKTLTITDDAARKAALAKLRTTLKQPIDNVPAYLKSIAPKREAPVLHRQSVRGQRDPEVAELSSNERSSLVKSFRDLRDVDDELVQLNESVLATGDLMDRSPKKTEEDELDDEESIDLDNEEIAELDEEDEAPLRISPAKVKKESTADLHRLNRKKGETSENALTTLLAQVQKQNEITVQIQDKLERQEYDKQIGVFYNDLQQVNGVIPQLERSRDEMNFQKMQALNKGNQAEYLRYEKLHNDTKRQLEQAYEIRNGIANKHKEFNTGFEQRLATRKPAAAQTGAETDQWGFDAKDHRLINEGAALWAQRHPELDVDIETGEGNNAHSKKVVELWRTLVQEGNDPREISKFYKKLEDRIAREIPENAREKSVIGKTRKPVVSGGSEAAQSTETGIPAEVRISELPTMVQKMYRNLKTPKAQKSFLRDYFSKQRR